jgi:serine protease
LTATNTQGGGGLILWPHGAPQPLTSNINYAAWQTVANSFNVGLSGDGKLDLFVHVSGTDVIIDVASYVM